MNKVWEGVSVKRQNGEVGHATRELQRGDQRNFLYFFKQVDAPRFTDDRLKHMVIPADYEEMVYAIVNERADKGVIIHEPSGEKQTYSEDVLSNWEWADPRAEL